MRNLTLFAVLCLSTLSAWAQPAGFPKLETWVGPALQTGVATLVREYPAPEARQGVAVDEAHVYAIVNTIIAKYDKSNGALVSRWMSPRGGPIRHINSCYAAEGKLWCANSNFPEVPMGSSVEIFDAATMTHLESHSLGLLEEGSLTFFEPYEDGFLAGFAHYDQTGGTGYKGSRYGSVFTYDARWRRTGGWLIPESVQARMAPHAASGGSIGPDGLLYLLGHDRTEMYVLAKPRLGPVMLHLATIDIAAEGQALVWDRTAPGRRVYAISRPKGVIRAFDVPEVTLDHPDARRFPVPGAKVGN
ncbi:MAG: hypothetical protein MUF01_09575 [Bryobacterales bacterium]|jgi:hypothetical protein|nr:hypothetical protein [Bryobacterales bacterium]